MESRLKINYIIFAILYSFSIFFSYQENTQSLAILVLFVVNTSFLLYMGKDMPYHMSNKGSSPSMLQYIIIFSILGAPLINSLPHMEYIQIMLFISQMMWTLAPIYMKMG